MKRTLIDIVMLLLTSGLWLIWMIYRQHKINERNGH